MDFDALIDFLLRQLYLAGDYALAVQQNVRATDEKGGNLFAAALTDADLSIQTFFEVALLARFPEVSFFGEEYDKSYNSIYFPAGAHVEVTLDPVNGTRLFIDKFDTFDIVVTVSHGEQLTAAMTYLPASETVYLAVRGQGAFVFTRREAEAGKPRRRLAIVPHGDRIMMFNDPELLHALEPHVSPFDFVTSYLERPSSVTLNSVLRGEIGGWVRRNAPLIDVGAIAFIAEQAGAIVTDFSGRPLPPYPRSTRRVPEQVVAASVPLHTAIIRALQSAGH